MSALAQDVARELKALDFKAAVVRHSRWFEQGFG